MCYIRRKHYTCGHISPIHSAAHIQEQQTAEKKADPYRQWPTHEDTSLMGCQDAGRRGGRCNDRLEDLEEIVKDLNKVCEQCEGKKKRNKMEAEVLNGEKTFV